MPTIRYLGIKPKFLSFINLKQFVVTSVKHEDTAGSVFHKKY